MEVNSTRSTRSCRMGQGRAGQGRAGQGRAGQGTFSEKPNGFALIPFLASIMPSRQGVRLQTLTQGPPGSVMLHKGHTAVEAHCTTLKWWHLYSSTCEGACSAQLHCSLPGRQLPSCQAAENNGSGDLLGPARPPHSSRHLLSQCASWQMTGRGQQGRQYCWAFRSCPPAAVQAV